MRFTQLSNPETDDIDRNSVGLALAYAGRFLLDQARILDRVLTKTGLYAKLTIEGPVSNVLSFKRLGTSFLLVVCSVKTNNECSGDVSHLVLSPRSNERTLWSCFYSRF